MTSQAKNGAMACNPATTRRHVESRSHGVKYATGLTAVTRQAQCGVNVTGADTSHHVTQTQLRKKIRLGTWNVRGMIQPGKLEIIGREQLEHNADILGLTETHMRGSGFHSTPFGHTLYFSGPEKESRNGVALSLSPRINKAILGYNPVSDRIITMKINTKPCRMNLIVVYAPTAVSPENEIEGFYQDLEDTLKSFPKREITLLMGDLNAKVGSTTCDDHLRDVVGKFGLGERNDRGEMWLQFCTENALTIMNTCFENHPRRLYTWVMPGDRCRNQIDYIAIDKRWRSCIRNTKTYPGADCGSDHRLLMAEMIVKLKRCHRTMIRPQRRPNARELPAFRECFERRIAEISLNPSNDIDTNWTAIKELILSARNEIRTVDTDIPRNAWITEETWTAIKERKVLIAGKTDAFHDDYRLLSARIQRLCRRDYNQYLNSICQDIENHAQHLHTKDLFLKVKNIIRDVRPKTWIIDDGNGNLMTEIDQVTERWRSYCQGLYTDNRRLGHTDISIEQNHLEPVILKSEVQNALRKLKNNKSAGIDTIFAEELKCLSDISERLLLDLCNQVWRTGKWPTDWKQSLLVPIHKKGSTKSCQNYRTVALISHASKAAAQESK
ncbi:uncharacterized protein [Epargyreus clarus]|uniref:uncharacterized protein n=1 Tax=Epargyreus clarus TaxID=520877 RepID=UPI003C309A93